MSVKKSQILIVDDEASNRLLLTGILSPLGYQIREAGDGVSALESVAQEKPDLILLDVVMPRKNGYEVLKELKTSKSTKLIPIVMLTSLDQLQDKLRAMDLGADDFINKPFNLAELTTRVKALLSLKHYTDELEYVYDVLMSISKIVEIRDLYTSSHCTNVGNYAEKVARIMGLGEEDIENLKLGAAFHDIGKIAISDFILQKPGRLTPEEIEIVKTHPVVGADLLKPMHTLEKALPLIRHHHEKLDGTGYPDGLKGDQISLPVRIISVVDIYEALISKRPYKNALSPEKALEILGEEVKKGWWDSRVFEILVKIVQPSV